MDTDRSYSKPRMMAFANSAAMHEVENECHTQECSISLPEVRITVEATRPLPEVKSNNSLGDSASFISWEATDSTNANSSDNIPQTKHEDFEETKLIEDSTSPNRPSQFLFATWEGRQQYLDHVGRLHRAIMRKDCRSAMKIIRTNPSILRQSITGGDDTVLHIAAIENDLTLVENLLNNIGLTKGQKEELIKLENGSGNIALAFGVIAGNEKIVKKMIETFPDLPDIHRSGWTKALRTAILLKHSAIVKCLNESANFRIMSLSPEARAGIFFAYVRSGFYDEAQKMLENDTSLATARESFEGYTDTALHILARSLLSFPRNGQPGTWRRFIYSATEEKNTIKQKQYCSLIKSLWEIVLQRDYGEMVDIIKEPSLLSAAIESGNAEFLAYLIHLYPELMWQVDKEQRSVFHLAVLHRQESIFSLIYDIGAIKDLISFQQDIHGNNMLHLAAKLPSPERLNVVSGAALQMQRELLWFKEVEKIVQPSYKNMKNTTDEMEPWNLFVKEHEDLMKKGEIWTKGIAKSSLFVSTLMATVLFAALFIVPGCLVKQKSGTPIFLHERSFVVFATSDSVALFFSLTSILMLLSILISPHREIDFLKELPFKMMIGIAALFVSIASMLIAFSATMFIFNHHKTIWVPILITVSVAVPVAAFVPLHSRLFTDIWRLTSGCRFTFQSRRLLFLEEEYTE